MISDELRTTRFLCVAFLFLLGLLVKGLSSIAVGKKIEHNETSREVLN